jgi:hypothetical protein
MQKLESALNDAYVTPRQPSSVTQGGHAMLTPDALQLSMLEGFGRNLAEREGFETLGTGVSPYNGLAKHSGLLLPTCVQALGTRRVLLSLPILAPICHKSPEEETPF